MDDSPKINKTLVYIKIKKYFLCVMTIALVICFVLFFIHSKYIILTEGVLLPRPRYCLSDFPYHGKRNQYAVYFAEEDSLSQIEINFKRKDINRILESCRVGVKNHQECKQIKECQVGGMPSYLVYGEYKPETQNNKILNFKHFVILLIPEKEILIHYMGTKSGVPNFEKTIDKTKFLWI